MHFLRCMPPLFYLGLLPVVILLGLWADSAQHQTGWAYCRGPQHRWTVATGGSEIYLEHMEIKEFDPAAVAGMKLVQTGERGDWTRIPADSSEDSELFPWPDVRLTTPVTFKGSGGPDLDIYSLSLPYWLILLCYLPPWHLLTFWQARRRKRRNLKDET